MKNKAKPKIMKLNNARRNAIIGYIFIAPFIIGFLAFMVVPLFESLRMSFSDVIIGIGNGGFKMEWAGLANYKKALFVHPDYNRWLVEELSRMSIQVPAILIVSFFMALLINHEFKGRGLVRAIFFLPVILSSGVLVGLEYNNSLLSGMAEYIKESSSTANITSVLENILRSSGFGKGMMDTVFSIVNSVYDIVIASGIQIIIFLSALKTIPKSMFEAAHIEGCTTWEAFWKITLPMVSPVILVNLVYTVIDFFTKSDSRVMTLISDTMVAKMDYGFSSAMAWLYFAAVISILGILSAIISKWVYYYE